MGDLSRPDSRLVARIMETSPAAIVVVDREGRITFCNARAESVLGVSRDAATQLTYNSPAWRPTDLAGAPLPEEALPFRRVMATRQPVNDIRYAIERPDGARTLISVNAAPLLDDAGGLTGMVATVEDITERSRIEGALADSEQRARAFIERSPMGIHMYDLAKDGRLVFAGANPAADRILGIDHRELVGKTIEEAFPPLIETEVPERYRRAAGQGEPWQTRHIAYQDERISGAYEVFAFQTKPGSMATLFLDITTRLQAEQQLRLARYSIEHAADAAFWIDESGRFLEVNKAACESFGYTHDELCASRVCDVVPQLPAAAWPERWMLLRERGAYHAETEYRRKDGTLVPVEVTASYVAFEGREYVFGWAQDISTRKRAEEERAQLQAQFLQSQKMETIGRLAGGVAHDFNNLLMAICGYADLLLERLSPEAAMRREVDEIRLAGERATALTRQLLAFSRRQAPEPQVLSLNDVVSEAQHLLGRIIGEDVRLEFRPDPALWSVSADPTQIDQILVNLATNARDAMPTGGHLTLETGNLPAAEGQPASVLLVARDTGCGMDDATRGRVFEPFFSTKSRGTGLGLATVREIVDQHGGHVELESELGRGTTVRVTFPALPAESRRQRPIPSATVSAPGRGETVLLVEDDAGVRRLTSDALERFGYEVIEARDAQEALHIDQRRAARVQLLLSDVVLPGMNGLQLAEALRGSNAGLRVIFVSGYAEDVLERHGRVPSDAQLLTKPYSIADLARKVRETLDA